MPKITIKTPGAKPPAKANPADEDLDPTDADDRSMMGRATEFVTGRYANRKAKRSLRAPRDIAGRRG